MNIIITGAGKGIGKQLAKIFAQKKETKLFLISRSSENLTILKNECNLLNQSCQIFCIPFDLEKIVTEGVYPEINCEHIDILINNAGYLINNRFTNLNETDIIKMLNINFLAPAYFIRKFSSDMGGERASHIVNIGSMGGFQGSSKFAGLSIYSASKAALATLTECLAVEFKEENIFCNCLALGAVQTEMLETAFPGYKAPVTAVEMAKFIADFALEGYKFFNGKIIPVSSLSI